MHRYRPLMITIALLFAMCLFSACVSPIGPANQTPTTTESPRIDAGITSIDMPPDQRLVSFDEAKSFLRKSEWISLNKFQKTRILFIRGSNLDESGNAGQWVFGINKGDINELRVYGQSGWTIISWPNAISAEEINLDNVASPASVFAQNQNKIHESSSSTIPDRRDLELRNGTYQITITSGSTSEILMFNATTGAALE
jgi:hypothetical protein